MGSCMKKSILRAALMGLVLVAACDDVEVSDVAALQIIDVTAGTGATATAGRRVTVHYTGWLYDADAVDHHGDKIDSSRDRGAPYAFLLGAGDVIRGWDQGVVGMRVGGRRTLIIPSSLAYGPGGSGSVPGGSALVFDIELLLVE
jgi:FKBP-type peptidyl-prolyl cis-trans isomerase FkpA